MTLQGVGKAVFGQTDAEAVSWLCIWIRNMTESVFKNKNDILGDKLKFLLLIYKKTMMKIITKMVSFSINIISTPLDKQYLQTI